MQVTHVIFISLCSINDVLTFCGQVSQVGTAGWAQIIWNEEMFAGWQQKSALEKGFIIGNMNNYGNELPMQYTA